MARIFSDIERTDPSPAAHGDGQFNFLDRVAGPYWDQVRYLMEDWFARLCPDGQADIRSRLRSKDDRQVRGAFFELYLHECLLRMGYSVTCHPPLEGTTRRPDFLAEKDGRAMYVEARSESSSDVAVGASGRVNDVYESLDRLSSPNFFLWIEIKRQGPRPLRTKPLRGRLEKWLSELDPDSITLGGRREDLPSYRHEEQASDAAAGWIIDFWAIPRSPEARGREGARPLGVFGGGEASWVQEEEGILGALSDKGTAYGDLGAPFIVAISTSSLSLDDHDVLNALYGTEVVRFGRAADGTELHAIEREPNGYWFAGDHWDHRGVSAVLIVKQLHPAFVGSKQHTIWEHPDPEQSVDPMPMWRRSVIGESGQLEFIEPLRGPSDWFDLGDPWPIGEPFPSRITRGDQNA